jgi:hypothetical protein
VLFLPEQTTPRQGGEFYLGDFEDFTIGGDNEFAQAADLLRWLHS